ncbi:MAG: 16S rRNA (cytosine1402-N4)-methyltransferase [Parcubacteria group bacterium Gr01-1014_38]|nr:MAG: 16S rRNA (cytosine1402-N4)-methyltransferase [Parcubacteria group bacterium Gr01-1014_38]
MRHVPVLQEEVVRFLTRPHGAFIDGTVGDGGHAAALLIASGPESRLLGLDLDPGALHAAAEFLAPFGEQVRLLHGTFADLKRHATASGFTAVSGILFDLGLRAEHLDAARGFSFRSISPLDMRFDQEGTVTLPEPSLPALQRLARQHPAYTAATLLARLSASELADVFSTYGDERFAERIAGAIVAARRRTPITTTGELKHLVIRALPRTARHGRIHGATRVFQALRIAVNRELESLERGLTDALNLLDHGGRLAVIAYHSGEDRIVKQRFREAQATGAFTVLTRRPLKPTMSEQTRNPRSRSAKLRILEHQ